MMAQGKVVSDADLPEAIRLQIAGPAKGAGVMTLEEVQSRHLEYVLKLVDGNKARAAEVLGVSRATIFTACWPGVFSSSRSKKRPIRLTGSGNVLQRDLPYCRCDIRPARLTVAVRQFWPKQCQIQSTPGSFWGHRSIPGNDTLSR